MTEMTEKGKLTEQEQKRVNDQMEEICEIALEYVEKSMEQVVELYKEKIENLSTTTEFHSSMFLENEFLSKLVENYECMATLAMDGLIMRFKNIQSMNDFYARTLELSDDLTEDEDFMKELMLGSRDLYEIFVEIEDNRKSMEETSEASEASSGYSEEESTDNSEDQTINVVINDKTN